TERLEQKSELINKLYQQTNHDWEETAYQALAANFGFKVNKDPFLQLARVLPYKIIRKHADKLLQIEALLLGIAGLLPQNTNDEYLQVLNREYTMLSHKYGLHDKQLNPAQWRLLRLRPANFPAIRLMQFAALLKEMNPLFSALTDFDDAKTLLRQIRVKQSDYWRKHYLPAKPSEKILPALGATSAENIAINTVVPLLVLYGKLRDEQARIEKAVDLLQQLKAEDNRITRRWQGINWKVNNAFDSQALIALYNNYCLKRRCLQCNIGCNLLRP
ncbi:MAG TPA: DUF2851 family protein, partial [Cyclobacteriaceae bacterium]|nr:DUF2851 family protein [Cyclobacteriaceae bacterium]